MIVFVEDAERSLPILMSFLSESGLSAERVSISKPTLDDVFLKYAGVRFEDRGRVNEVRHMRSMIRRG